MHTSIRTSRPIAQNSALGYLCTLILLVLAIGLLALRTPSLVSSTAPFSTMAPATTTFSGPDAGVYHTTGW